MGINLEAASFGIDKLRSRLLIQSKGGVGMDRMFKQFFLAVILGWVLPQMIFSIGSRMLSGEDTQEPTQTTVSASEPTETDTTSAVTDLQVQYIPVITGQNSVQLMELEDYIRGVVLAEMPASFEPEALKAQAVAARTYTMRHMRLADRHSEGAVCTDSTCCQAYISDADYLAGRGTKEDMDKVAAAVAETAGEVLTYNGTLIEATYFACSGGRTEDAAAVWGSEIPYLQAVDSPGETKAESYNEQLYYNVSQFGALLGRTLSGSPDSWLGKVTYTAGGGVDTMVIAGVTYSGTELRKLLGLNSTVFVMTADSQGIWVETQGWGHRVGMSQYGADAMAVAGSRYDEILTYYYQGTRIDKLADMG